MGVKAICTSVNVSSACTLKSTATFKMSQREKHRKVAYYPTTHVRGNKIYYRNKKKPIGIKTSLKPPEKRPTVHITRNDETWADCFRRMFGQ